MPGPRRRARPCGRRREQARQVDSSADLRRIRRWHPHHALVERCPEEQRGAITSVVDIVKHEAEFSRRTEAKVGRFFLRLRCRRIRLDQLETCGKFAGAETRLMEALALAGTTIESVEMFALLSSGPAFSVSANRA